MADAVPRDRVAAKRLSALAQQQLDEFVVRARARGMEIDLRDAERLRVLFAPFQRRRDGMPQFRHAADRIAGVTEPAAIAHGVKRQGRTRDAPAWLHTASSVKDAREMHWRTARRWHAYGCRDAEMDTCTVL